MEKQMVNDAQIVIDTANLLFEKKSFNETETVIIQKLVKVYDFEMLMTRMFKLATKGQKTFPPISVIVDGIKPKEGGQK